MSDAIVVCGLLFGDEGKGRVVDALVRRLGAPEVVRFGGGPQAAHRVVAPDGTCHVFAQFPAGLLVPGTRGRISRGMLVDPLALMREAEALRTIGVDDALSRTVVDPRCRLVTPLHQIVGRARELARGARRHGSCGRGVGEAVRDARALGDEAPVVGDLLDAARLRHRLRFLWRVKLDHTEQLADESADAAGVVDALELLQRFDVDALADDLQRIGSHAGLRLEADEALEPSLRAGRSIIFEGAQGALLDATRGLLPHVTATDTSFAPAVALIDEIAPGTAVTRIGVLRAYATRHGAGPFPTEDRSLALADPHNVDNSWQGSLRVGWLDLVLARAGLAIAGGVDSLAVTCLDRLPTRPAARVATAWRMEPVHALAIGAENDASRVLSLSLAAASSEELRRTLTTGLIDGVEPIWAQVADDVELLELLASSEGLGRPWSMAGRGERAGATEWRGWGPPPSGDGTLST